MLLKQTGANIYTIKFKKNKQSFSEPIYSLKPVEFEILKIYIDINLINSFIKASKLPKDIFILFF